MLRSSGKNSSFFENLEVQAIKHEKARKKGQQHLGGGTALRFAPEKAEAGPGPGGFVAIPGRKVATPDFKRSTMDRFDGPGAFMAQAREDGPGPGAYHSVEDEVSVDGTSVLAQNGGALCYF